MTHLVTCVPPELPRHVAYLCPDVPYASLFRFKHYTEQISPPDADIFSAVYIDIFHFSAFVGFSQFQYSRLEFIISVDIEQERVLHTFYGLAIGDSRFFPLPGQFYLLRGQTFTG